MIADLVALVQAAAGKQLRSILVVDDEFDIVEALRDLLEGALPKVKVFTAASGPEALQILQKEHVSLIVTDYRMPNMNGVEFLARAARVQPGVPHLMITAFDRELTKELGIGAQEEIILPKPLDPVGLVDHVRRMLAAPSP